MAAAIGGPAFPADDSQLRAALAATLSGDGADRCRAESQLRAWGEAGGAGPLAAALAAVAGDGGAEAGLRASAAVLLKQTAARGGAGVHAALAPLLLPLLERAIAETGVASALTNNIDDAARAVVRAIPGGSCADAALAIVRSPPSPAAAVAALAVLMHAARDFEFHRADEADGRVALERFAAAALPAARALAAEAAKNPATLVADERAAATVKLAFKLFWSLTQMSVLPAEQVAVLLAGDGSGGGGGGGGGGWLQLALAVLAAFVPGPAAAAAGTPPSGGAAQAAKARRAALRLTHRLLSRYANPAYAKAAANDGSAALDPVVREFAPVLMQLMHETLVKQDRGEVELAQEEVNLVLQHFTACLSLASTYKLVKPHLPFLLFEFAFKQLRFSDADAETWAMDPTEYIRRQSSSLGHAVTVREAAVEFVQEVARRRGKDAFAPLLQFTELVFKKHSSAAPLAAAAAAAGSGSAAGDSAAGVSAIQTGVGPDTGANATASAVGLDRDKDGALYLLGCVADRLRSRKRNLQLEPFVSQFVLPELSNRRSPFLRLRACWLLRNLLTPEKESVGAVVKDERLLLAAFEGITGLCGDGELPVAVEAVVALRPFFQLQVPAVHTAVERHLALLMDQLFRVMRCMPDNEAIVTTIEALITNFEDKIPPFAKVLLEYLSNTLLAMMEVVAGAAGSGAAATGGAAATSAAGTTSAAAATSAAGVPAASPQFADGGLVAGGSPFSLAGSAMDAGDTTFSAMSVASTIASILGTLTEPATRPMFDVVAESLKPLLDALLAPPGLDLLDEGLVILTYLASFCSPAALAAHLWRYFERMFQAVCGGDTPHLHLAGSVSEAGWAPDYLERMLPVIDRLVTRSPDAFASGACAVNGETRSYKHMAVDMMRKSATVLLDVDFDGLKSSLELVMVIFSAFAANRHAGVADLVAPALQVLKDAGDALAAANTDQMDVAPALAVLARALASLILYDWNAVLATGTPPADLVAAFLKCCPGVRAMDGRRVVILAVARLMELNAAPEAGAALAKQLAAHAKGYFASRAEADQEGTSSDDDEDGFASTDSEEELEENEDSIGDPRTRAVIERLAQSAARVNPESKKAAGFNGGAASGATTAEGQTDDDDSSVDSDDDSDDSDFFNEEASVDLLPHREPSLAALDELSCMTQLLAMHADLFSTALGVSGVEGFKKALEAEKARRGALPQKAS